MIRRTPKLTRTVTLVPCSAHFRSQTTEGVYGARALATGPLRGSGERHNLSSNPMGPEGVVALAASPHVEHLVSLGLTDVAAGADGARALAGARLPALE